MKPDNDKILVKFGIRESNLLGRGMEANVYTLDDEKVLKVYNNLSSASKQERLQRFYTSLDTSRVGFQTPTIYQIQTVEGSLVTVEAKNLGEPLPKLLDKNVITKSELIIDTYVNGLLNIGNIVINDQWGKYKLFDEYNVSDVKKGDWNSFLAQYIAKKRNEVDKFLSKDVNDYEQKITSLLKKLEVPYKGRYSLIHGDFCPANIFVDTKLQISGVIDFGMMTMNGDFLFDVVTGCAFFDMYDELGVGLSQKALEVAVHILGEHTRPILSFYLLLYSIISANTYSPICQDGHYHWCVGNLNNPKYW